MLLVCIANCLQSVLRCKFLILNTYHPDIMYLCKKGCEEPWLFFLDTRGLQTKTLGNTALGPSRQYLPSKHRRTITQ
jgi:hypothetical protein